MTEENISQGNYFYSFQFIYKGLPTSMYILTANTFDFLFLIFCNIKIDYCCKRKMFKVHDRDWIEEGNRVRESAQGMYFAVPWYGTKIQEKEYALEVKKEYKL